MQVVNVNNGERLKTYLIKGKRGSGICCLNGPAARRGMVGDVVVIISYATMYFEEAKKFKPWVVFPKEGNRHNKHGFTYENNPFRLLLLGISPLPLPPN